MSAGPFSSLAFVPVSGVLEAFVAATPKPEPAAVPLADAEGLVLAEALVARGALPPRAVALRPGWAVEARATAGAGPYSPVLLPSKPVFVVPGTVLPPGTDAVLPPDALTESAGSAEIGEAVAPGDGVRRAGEDATPGAELCPAGTRVTANHIAAAGAAGIDRFRVVQPHVTIVAHRDDPTGDYLARFAAKQGAATRRLAADGEGWLAAAGDAEQGAHVLVGLDPEAVVPTLARAGTTVLGRLAARPGEGTVCALLERTPVIVAGHGLGEAVAAALLVLGPWLERVTGRRPPPRRSGRLTRKLASNVGLTEIALVRILGPAFEPLAVADLTLTALARADAFVTVPQESEGWPAGAIVEAVDL